MELLRDCPTRRPSRLSRAERDDRRRSVAASVSLHQLTFDPMGMNAHPQRREAVESGVAIAFRRVAVGSDHVSLTRPELGEPAREMIPERHRERTGLVEVADGVHEVELGEIREPLRADRGTATQPAQELHPALVGQRV